jgi:hypothetical protein
MSPPYNPQYPYMPDPNMIGSAVPMPGGKVKGPSFWEKIQAGLMPVPAGMEGLLSPEETKAGRMQGLLSMGASLLSNSGPKTADKYVGFGPALGQALQAGQGAMQAPLENKMNVMQLQAAKAGLEGKQLELARAKKISDARQAIIAKYPPPTNEPGAMAAWSEKVLPHFIEIGDSDTVGQLTDLRKSLTPKDRYQQTQVGDAATTFDPATGTFYDPSANGGKGGWTTSVARGMNPDEKANKALDRQLRQAQIAETRSATEQRSLQSQNNAFMSRNKDVVDRAAILKQALTTLRDSQNDPALYTSSVANFIQAADQKAQIRWQLLKYFKENVDPSVGGKWETLKARMLEGKLPGYVSTSMIRHVSKLLAMSQEEYDRRRSGEIKRHSQLEGWIPPGEELFSEGSYGPGGANYGLPGGGSATQRIPGESPEDYMARTGGQ